MTKSFSDKVVSQIRQLRNEFASQRKGDQIVPGLSEYVDDPEVYFAKTPTAGIPARSVLELGNAECELYKSPLYDDTADPPAPRRDLAPMLDEQNAPIKRYIHNLSELPIAGGIYIRVWRHKDGTWFTTEPPGGGGLVGGCLAENHPGRGVPFDIHLGTWSTADNEWIYDVTGDTKAIDWRFGTPYPEAGATGLFEARESDEYGTIWEVVALDCSSPGECGS